MSSSVNLDEILAIDGNRPVYERLQALLAEGSAMAFVGSGASCPLYPLWGQLIESLADEPLRRGLAAEADKQQWLRTVAQKPLHVAGRIREKLKDPFYHAFLFETFKERTGPGGQCYTPAQAAIIRANFKAVLTTNYDGGLVEARRLLRPEIRDTGFGVWNQDYAMNRWASGDVFREGAPCPILFAHGHYNDPPSIVLDTGSYRRAYHDTPYRRLFENLWIQEHLVFIGFSFNDIVLAQIAEEVLWSTARQGGGEPRHVAILGLDAGDAYTPEMRHEYLEPFNAQVIFYPVRRDADSRPDHSALQVLLDSLAPAPGAGDRTAIPTPGPAVVGAAQEATGQAPPARFVHESTDDEKFTGRDNVLQRLDDWAADPGVRLVGITGIGGLGKTALLGRWLKRDGAAPPHKAEGVFFWSYYRDGDTNAMLRALLDFAGKELNWQPPKSLAEASLVEQATALLGQRRLVVALDGLEVVQESPGTVAYGKLLAADLSDLLYRHGRHADSAMADDAGLIVLTSRFPFPDLTPYLGGSLRSLPLPELEPAEGSALMAALGVAGEEADRQEVSRRLSGHPLALRVFARAMPPDFAGDPTRLWKQVFDSPHLSADDSLAAKMQRLLGFYEQLLSESQRLALGLLALFRMPVGEPTLAVLWDRCRTDSSAGSLRAILDGLYGEHLLTVDRGADGMPRYACHPILSDHFRGRLLGQAASIRDAAELLARRPDAGGTPSLESIQLVTAAIEILLEAGEVKAADDLYRTRLQGGGLFRWLPAPHWGMEVARWFVRDDERRGAVQEHIGNRRLSYYLNEVALLADIAGEPETALAFYPQAAHLDRGAEDWKNLSIVLQNLSDTEVSLGLLASAREHVAEAVQLARKIEDNKEMKDCLAWDGFIASLSGNVAAADAAFAEANAIESRTDVAGKDLYSLKGVRWAEHLLRTGDPERARTLTDANRKICRRHNAHDDVGRCEWILGWLDVEEANWKSAERHLVAARDIFLRGHMIYERARTLLTESAMWLGLGRHSTALAACERALHLAAPRNYRLVHADALIQRARIRLGLPTPEPGRARDDAEAALQLAQSAGYAWGQRDAHALLARAYGLLKQADPAARHQAEADQWTRRLARPA